MAGARRSTDAPGKLGYQVPTGPVTLSAEAMTSYEDAVLKLLKDPRVKDRWDADDLWGVVAMMVVDASQVADVSATLKEGLDLLRESEPALVVLPVANVTLGTGAIEVGDVVLGLANGAWRTAVNRVANGRADLTNDAVDKWLRRVEQLGMRGEGTAPLFAAWTTGQRDRAIEEASLRLEDLLSLALLLEENLADLELRSLRGSTNRPGVRGLRVDRNALEGLLKSNDTGGFELSSNPLIVSDSWPYRVFQWYGAEPVPFDRLLRSEQKQNLIGRCLASDEPIPARLRVAARWFANAHWADDDSDAALSLGVALDAIVGSTRSLPGYRMAQRFALLDNVPNQWQDRVRRYSDIYGVRSAIAHGGRASELNKAGYIRGVAGDVAWAALRLVELGDVFRPDFEKALDETFDALGLGAAAWP